MSLLFATASSVFADGHEGTLPATGGTIEFASGVTVKTPDGASSSDVTVTYTALEGDDVPGDAPEGMQLGSLVFTLDTGGAVFTQLAEVTVPFTDEDQAAAAGGRADNVTVLSWEPVSGTWIDTFALLDIINNTLTVSSTTLGTYAVVVTLPADGAPTPTPEITMTPDVPVEPTPPPTGGFGVSNSLMMGLLLMGALFLMGGGYVLVRNRNR